MRSFCPRACGRILWREAAEQTMFCIGIFALLMVMRASLTTMEAFDMIPPRPIAFHFGMALFMTAIYAAASAALLFTAEVDAGTFVFQRTKPIGWLTYLCGKLCWTVLSTLVLGVIAWLTTGWAEGRFPDASDTSFVFGVCGVGIVEGLTWGLIATLAIRGPLRAVIAAIATGSLAAYITAVIHHAVYHADPVLVTTAYNQAAWLRLIVTGVAFLAGILLARVWYRTGQPIGRTLFSRPMRGAAGSAMASGQWAPYGQPCRGRWIRLLWQAWRQVRSPAVAYWGCCLISLVGAVLYYRGKIGQLATPNNLALDCTTWAAIAVFGFSSVLAGYTFGADQKSRFLQSARDGVSPLEIWLSRLIVIATVLLPPTLVLYVGARFSVAKLTELPLYQPLAILVLALAYVSALAIGQGCSMFVRSRIIALLAAPTLFACFACWVAFAVFWGRLDWKFGAAPLLAALVIGTRLLAGTRLRQDNSWRAMRIPALLVIVAVFFSYRAFGIHRVNEIPPYDSPRPMDDALTAAGVEQILGYGWSFQGTPREIESPRQWIKDKLTVPNDAMFFELNVFNDPRVPPLDSFGEPWNINACSLLGLTSDNELTTYSQMLEKEASLNRTLRDVVAETDIPNERIRVCIEFLAGWPTKRFPHSGWLTVSYLRDKHWLQYGPVNERFAKYGLHQQPLPWQYRWFSFERKRMLRVLYRAYQIAAERVEQYEEGVLADQTGLPRHRYAGILDRWDIVPYRPDQPIWYQVPSETIVRHAPNEPGFHLPKALSFNWYWDDPFYTAEAQRRGTILYLALRMYHSDHGRLPDSLDKLVEGEYLDELPLVPIVCQPFSYEPSDSRERFRKAVKRLQAPENRNKWWAAPYSHAFGTHDESAPFVWYPSHSDLQMDPWAGPGWFIDLDFAQQDSE